MKESIFRKTIVLLFFSMFFLNLKIFAQDKNIPLLERNITLNVSNQKVPQVLDAISKQGGFIFSYSPDAINSDALVTFNVKNRPVRHVLNLVFDGNVRYKVRGKYIILKRNSSEEESIDKKEQLVEGYVYDSKSGEKITEATVYDKNLLASAVTDNYGYFKMELPSGTPTSRLHVSKKGYTDTLISNLSDRVSYVNVTMSSNSKDSSKNTLLKSSVYKAEEPDQLSEWMISKKILINTRNLSDTIFRHTQFSLLPFLSTNKLLTGNTVNDYSFNVTIGYVQEVRIAEFGGVINGVRNDAKYCQMGGIANIVGGSSEGFQAAGILNYAKSVKGVQAGGIMNFVLQNVKSVQMGGIANVAGDSIEGVQLAGMINYAKTLNGLQASGILNFALKDVKSCQLAGILNSTGGSVTGAQIAGILNFSKSIDGVQAGGIANIAHQDVHKGQVAGIVNYADRVNGAQVGGILNLTLSDIKGFQLAGIGNIVGGTSQGVQVAGILNYSAKNYGTQIASLVNVASVSNGVQLGCVNISDSCEGIPIGLFSFVNRGYHKIELSADEIFYSDVAFRSGVKHFHNIFMAGLQPAGSLWTFGYGLGTSFGNHDKLLFDLDLTGQQLIKGSYINSQNILYKVYAGIDRKILPKFSIVAGITFNFLMTDFKSTYFNDTFSKLAPYYFSNSTSGHGLNFKTWLGGKVAIRFL
jgi:hypothetical protein